MDSTENNGRFEQFAPDFYCVINDKDNDFYWCLNLEDHPNSFLLDQNYQNLISPKFKDNQETMVIIQPNC